MRKGNIVPVAAGLACLATLPATAQGRFYAGPGWTDADVAGPGTFYGPQPNIYRHWSRRHWRRDSFNDSYYRWRREGYPYFWLDQ
jgi:hypothetical protein